MNQMNSIDLKTTPMFHALLESLKETEESNISINNHIVSRNTLKKQSIELELSKQNITITNAVNLTRDLLLCQSTMKKTMELEKKILDDYKQFITQ